jgi:hypothetical protein
MECPSADVRRSSEVSVGIELLFPLCSPVSAHSLHEGETLPANVKTGFSKGRRGHCRLSVAYRAKFKFDGAALTQIEPIA